MPPRKKPEPKKIVLNEEQQEVVRARAGYYAVISGPGSGKSQCATMRYVSLLNEGVDPSQILAVTFTNAAAKNLRERVESFVGPLKTDRIAGPMTLHSWALKFAQEERDQFPFELEEFPLATEPTYNKMTGESARRYEVDPRTLRPAISVFKRKRISPKDAIKTAENSLKASELKIALAYKDFDKRLREAKLLDFDSLISESVALLEAKPEVRAKYQYQFVIVDEAQDCCRLDFEFLRLVTQKHGNLMCVGDPGQNLFSFRGSDPRLFTDMSGLFPGTRVLYLSTNYRSTPEVIDFFRPFGASAELSKRFHTPNCSGPAPGVAGFLSAQDECAFVISQIQKEIHGGDLL